MLASSSTEDFYNINIGDGYKIVVKPTIGVGDCQVAGCHNNLDKNCPLELRLVEGLIGRVVVHVRPSTPHSLFDCTLLIEKEKEKSLKHYVLNFFVPK
ncbi:hypothetical protein CDL15_Pgr011034 [Punica granatum]|uniref:Uncharacterized protein n=1 Tax=Punica granatum TaxID=22663 RepID=A0A218XN34_PUNGR|nr:hypothetical protein CDL15_Pgr011034 [Punica granatum]